MTFNSRPVSTGSSIPWEILRQIHVIVNFIKKQIFSEIQSPGYIQEVTDIVKHVYRRFAKKAKQPPELFCKESCSGQQLH